MKRKLLNSFLILTIIAVFVVANIQVSSFMLENYPEFTNGIIACLSYTCASVLTFAYTYVVMLVGKIYVPSLKPEISKLNPRVIVLGFVMILAMNIVLRPLVDMVPAEYMEVLDKYMNNGFWAMVVAVIVAPIFEEFLFRGVVQTNLIRSFGVYVGIVVGALVFGAMHVIPQQMISGAGAGLVFGSIYYLTGSFNTVIAIHFVNNGFTYLLFMLFSDANQFENYVLENTTVRVVVYSVSLIILILGGSAVVHRERALRIKS